MPGLDRRIEALEASHSGEPCEECGFDGDLSKMDYAVEWDDLDALEEGERREPDPQPEWCGTCGHQIAYVITWEDIPDGETLRRGH